MIKPWHMTSPHLPNSVYRIHSSLTCSSTKCHSPSPTTHDIQKEDTPQGSVNVCATRHTHSESIILILCWHYYPVLAMSLCPVLRRARHSIVQLVLEGKIWCFTWNSLCWNCTQSGPHKFPSPGWHRCYSLHRHRKTEKNLLIYPKR